MNNPAWTAFASQIQDKLLLAQVWIARLPGNTDSFELRHQDDAGAAANSLKPLDLAGLFELAQFTATQDFRPLRSAPNLASGWIHHAADIPALGLALQNLYPGALEDWWAVAHSDSTPPVTSYRQYTNRQSGMYRVTQKLDDSQVIRVTQAVCDRTFCLKRRLWSVSNHPVDPAGDKSIIPCLEPCAILVEFARAAFRWEQEPKTLEGLAPAQNETLHSEKQLKECGPSTEAIREADFAAPLNPRRIRYWHT